MDQDREKNGLNRSVSRRTFIKISGALASAAMASQVFTRSKVDAAPLVATGENPTDSVESAEDIIDSVCQMCHSRCGIRAKVKEGVLVKIDGNPYHPNNLDVDGDNRPERLHYSTSPEVAVKSLGRLCLKGQSGIQTVYDPFRIQYPLKRVGPRNSGKWQTITWEQAFSEIVAKINQLIPLASRNVAINPNMAELGQTKNQLAFAPGRSVEEEMSERVWKNAWGSANYGLAHTSICEETRHVANELITWDPNGTKNSLGAGRTEGWQPDILGAEYIRKQCDFQADERRDRADQPERVHRVQELRTGLPLRSLRWQRQGRFSKSSANGATPSPPGVLTVKKRRQDNVTGHAPEEELRIG